ncbi:hypothetical protein D6_0008 [Aeromonas phage D6]|uniref:Uncharacterized protein n=1 Tax=Aeromonas phage D6 TaxID=2593322 RepID=A0ACD0UH22_9CAUD|nr:hypothetical protein PQC08_gp267 [Aeromonas phage D6]QDJ97184.2 hypothetical protein D6_0008 [Aeromonas phage D6]
MTLARAFIERIIVQIILAFMAANWRLQDTVWRCSLGSEVRDALFSSVLLSGQRRRTGTSN